MEIHACKFLSDAAGLDAPTWDMTDSGRAQLIEALTTVFREVPGDLSFSALWSGDCPTANCTVTTR